MRVRRKRNTIVLAILGLLLGGMAFFQGDASAPAADQAHSATLQNPDLARIQEDQADNRDAGPGKLKRPALDEKETSAIIRAALEVRIGEVSMITLPASAAELDQIPGFDIPDLQTLPDRPLRLRKVSQEAITPVLERQVRAEGRLKAKLGKSEMDDYRVDDFRVTLMESTPSQSEEQEVTLMVASPDLSFTGAVTMKKGTLLLLDRSSVGKESILIAVGSN